MPRRPAEPAAWAGSESVWGSRQRLSRDAPRQRHSMQAAGAAAESVPRFTAEPEMIARRRRNRGSLQRQSPVRPRPGVTRTQARRAAARHAFRALLPRGLRRGSPHREPLFQPSLAAQTWLPAALALPASAAAAVAPAVAASGLQVLPGSPLLSTLRIQGAVLLQRRSARVALSLLLASSSSSPSGSRPRAAPSAFNSGPWEPLTVLQHPGC